MSRPFAAFDIDGTVMRWQLYHAQADELAREGHISPEKFEAVREKRMTWKKRASNGSFLEYEGALVELVDNALPGMELDVFMAASERVMQEYRDQVYTYTRNLIRKLKDEGYLLFAVSASQAPIVGMFATYYGFDDYGGSEYEVVDGKFTGKKLKLMKGTTKPQYVRELAEKYGATRQGSVGVGDSESDIPMLSSVERPIAFNPTRALFEHAREHGWEVVIERKNMIYELTPNGAGYELKSSEEPL